MVALAVGLAAGCTLPRAQRSLTDTDPTAKIPAIKQSAVAEDSDSVVTLVDDLDSDDPAIRFYAIRALRDITGESFGYRYFDDELERKVALHKWRVWLAEQTGSPMPESRKNPPATVPQAGQD